MSYNCTQNVSVIVCMRWNDNNITRSSKFLFVWVVFLGGGGGVSSLSLSLSLSLSVCVCVCFGGRVVGLVNKYR